jgi:hypothetical protein
MAISTYSELQTAIQNWLDDTNTLPVERCQEFIALAEADINRRLRVRDGLTSVTGVTVGGTATVALPADFGGVRVLSVVAGGSEMPLSQMAPNAAVEAYYGYGSGVPAYYTLEAAEARLFPTPDGAYTYTLQYWAKLAALSDSNTSNWLLASHPDVYLFGSLSHAEGFRINDQRLVGWKALYEGALEQVLQQSIADDIGRGFVYIEGGTP